MKNLWTVTALALTVLVIGCGVKKDYVAQEIAASEARTSSRLTDISSKQEMTAADIARLQQLAMELDKKADLAINKAAGFENYQILWQGEINFGFDSYDLTGEAQATLDEAGQALEANKSSIMEIGGFTDRTGPAAYNLALGGKRAEAARLYLNEKYGVALYRLFSISHGESKQAELSDQRNAGAKQRRVTLVVWGLPTADQQPAEERTQVTN